MERKGGCCLAPRYVGAGAGSGSGGQAWQMGRIMLKFRPIAPKPAAMAPAPTPAPVPAAAAVAGAGRGKRKAVGGGGGKRGRKPKKEATVAPLTAAAPAAPEQEAAGGKECEKEKSLSRSSSSSGMTSVDSSPPPAPQQPATLPLMPVLPVEEKVAAEVEEPAAPVAVFEEPASRAVETRLVPPLAPRPAAAEAASCWVTVEDVTATWRDGEGPSAVAAAAAAACAVSGDGEAPAFVSDQWGRVTWANAAFCRAGGDVDEALSLARLAGTLPAWGTCAGFMCRVRVVRPRLACGGSSYSVVAPCDVWRLDAGGCYLWRLDLQAALTLGGLP